MNRLLILILSCALLLILSLPLAARHPTAPQSATEQSQQPQPSMPQEQCVETDQITAYKVESDEIVRLFLQDSSQVLLRLKRHCPQLYFHRYISYTPVNGRICAGSDEIKTRAGLPCRIGSIEAIPDAKLLKENTTTEPNQP